MALLLILFALFGFVFAGIGGGTSSSSGSGSSTAPQKVPGYPQHSAVLKCSKRMGVKPSAQEQRRCGPPPANP